MEAVKKNKFQLKREKTYQNLLNAGMKVFCENGYASTRLEDITNEAGYTKGAFYVHFKNKQDFFFHLLSDQGFFFKEDHTEDELEIIGSDFESTISYWSRAVLNRYIASTWTLVFYDFYIQNRHDEKVQAFFHGYHQKWIKDVSRIIQGMQQKGWIASGADANRLAVRCYDIITGAIIHYHMCGNQVDPDDMTKAIMNLLK